MEQRQYIARIDKIDIMGVSTSDSDQDNIIVRKGGPLKRQDVKGTPARGISGKRCVALRRRPVSRSALVTCDGDDGSLHMPPSPVCVTFAIGHRGMQGAAARSEAGPCTGDCDQGRGAMLFASKEVGPR